jgi:hypothetical protein
MACPFARLLKGGIARLQAAARPANPAPGAALWYDLPAN